MTFLGPLERLKMWLTGGSRKFHTTGGAERRETDGDVVEAASNSESRYVFHPFKSDGGLE